MFCYISTCRGKNQAAKDIAGRHPVSLHWDPNESKLLVCEANLLPEVQQRKDQQNQRDQHRNIALTKATMEETVSINRGLGGLGLSLH